MGIVVQCNKFYSILFYSGAMLKQRHVNKQKDDFSSVLQQNESTKRIFHKICLRKNRCGC